MGEAINQVQIQQDLINKAHTDIHVYIQQIIPYLAQRKETAKRLLGYNQRIGITDELSENYQELIRWDDAKIKEILNIHEENK